MLSEEDDSSLETEIEALKSIYIHELEVGYNELNKPDLIKVQLYPATADNITEQYVKLLLVLKLHSQYPHCIPEVLIQNTRGLSDDEIECINKSIIALATERKGTPMLFELIEVTKEILTKVNMPSCQCAICLYGFAKNDVLIKTECFHYFHSHCLARYVLHSEKSFKEIETTILHETAESPKVGCPVCRLPISFSPSNESYPLPVESEKEIIEISKEVRTLQRKMQDLYSKQKQKGGIIDIEAEKNKYLLEIANVPYVVSALDNSATSKINVATAVNIVNKHLKESETTAQNHRKGEPEISDNNRVSEESKSRYQNLHKRYDSATSKVSATKSVNVADEHLKESETTVENHRTLEPEISDNNGVSNELKSSYQNLHKRYHRPKYVRQSISKSKSRERKPFQRKEDNSFNNRTLNSSLKNKNSFSFSRDESRLDKEISNSLPKYNDFSITEEQERANPDRKHYSNQTLHIERGNTCTSEVARDFKNISNRSDCKPQRYQDKRINNRETFGCSSYHQGSQFRRYNNKGRDYHNREFRNNSYRYGNERRNLHSEHTNSSNENPNVNETNKRSIEEITHRSLEENNKKTDYSINVAQRDKYNYSKTYQNTKSHYRNKRNENRSNPKRTVHNSKRDSEEQGSFGQGSEHSQDIHTLTNHDQNLDTCS